MDKLEKDMKDLGAAHYKMQFVVSECTRLFKNHICSGSGTWNDKKVIFVFKKRKRKERGAEQECKAIKKLDLFDPYFIVTPEQQRPTFSQQGGDKDLTYVVWWFDCQVPLDSYYSTSPVC